MISLERSHISVYENSSLLSISITKSDETTKDVIVEVTVTDGTARGK